MLTLAEIETQTLAESVRFEEDYLVVHLQDAREIRVPIAWYPRLANATREQRNHWRLIGDGEGIHWPAVDEDLPVLGLILGLKPPQKRQI
jgi:hypothetical protein